MLVRPGATMCGNHSGAGAACAHCRTRVADLAKHAPRCPAFLHKAAAAARPHYALDANVGNLEGDAEATREEAASLAADARAAALDAPALRAFAARVRDACERAGVDAATHREAARARGPLAPACARALRAQELASARAARGGVGAPPFERRHAEQHAAIVSRMIAADLVRDEDASEDPALEDDDDDEKHHQEKGPDEIAKAAAESSKSSNVARAAPTSPPSSKPPPVYVELGAGRGYLSHFLLDACGPADVVLVERETYRHKAERSIGAAYAERNRLARRGGGEKKNLLPLPEETVEEETAEAEEDARLVRSAIARRERSRVSRLRVDIKDLRLAGAAEAAGRRVVATGKHLCGAAADLALRCLLLPSHSDDDANADEGVPAPVEKNKKPPTASSRPPGFEPAGVAVATCCHHRCAWSSFVGRARLAALGFDAGDFATLAKVSSWGTGGVGHRGEPGGEPGGERGTALGGESVADSAAADGEGERRGDDGGVTESRAAEAASVLSRGDGKGADEFPAEEKAALGRAAKALLDECRAAFLRANGFEAWVEPYVATTVSPENRILLARRRSE